MKRTGHNSCKLPLYWIRTGKKNHSYFQSVSIAACVSVRNTQWKLKFSEAVLDVAEQLKGPPPHSDKKVTHDLHFFCLLCLCSSLVSSHLVCQPQHICDVVFDRTTKSSCSTADLLQFLPGKRSWASAQTINTNLKKWKPLCKLKKNTPRYLPSLQYLTGHSNLFTPSSWRTWQSNLLSPFLSSPLSIR